MLDQRVAALPPPRFLSKAEREEVKRQEEKQRIAAQRAREQEVRRHRAEFEESQAPQHHEGQSQRKRSFAGEHGGEVAASYQIEEANKSSSAYHSHVKRKNGDREVSVSVDRSNHRNRRAPPGHSDRGSSHARDLNEEGHPSDPHGRASVQGVASRPVSRETSKASVEQNGENGGSASVAPAGVHYSWDSQTQSHLRDLSLLQVTDDELKAVQQRKDLEQIREHYLGLRKEKRRIQKPSEKFRNIFNFEWSAAEDTAKGDNNVLYQARLDPQLLFGRGFRAGIDIREQRRHNNFYDELVRRRASRKQEQNGAPSGSEHAHFDFEEGQSRREDDAAVWHEVDEVTGRKRRRLNGKPTEGGGETSAGSMPPPSVAGRRKATAIVRARDIESSDPLKGKHWSEKSREEMTDRDWRIFREDFEIYIKGGRVPPPIRRWDESGLPQDLLDAIRTCGYEKPTPIQMQAIPVALEQRDLIGIAETGSGKTAAFVLPMLRYVKSLPPLTDDTSQDGPYALVLAPSRELALQIVDETRKFAGNSQQTCRAVAVVGGRSAEAQAFELRRGAEVVVGTPGRVKDCLERSYTVLSQCNYVTLDEADRMIDLGFEEIVNWILDQIPSSNLKSEDEDRAYQQELEAKAGYRRYRLTQMFSATMPAAVERLARKYLKAAAFISIGDPGAGKRAIEQRLEFMPEPKKKQRLEQILAEAEPPIMVFVNQKKVADVLAKTLHKMGFSAASLHGGKAQDIREQSLSDFKRGDVDILVATDVAGRGIDVEGVQLVLNFDMPKDIGSYTHRIGRTGRAGKKGLAISFVTEEDSALFYDLKQLLISTNNVIPVELAQHAASKVKPGTPGSFDKPSTASTSGSGSLLGQVGR